MMLRNLQTKEPWDGSGYMVQLPRLTSSNNPSSALYYCLGEQGFVYFECVHNLATAKWLQEKLGIVGAVTTAQT